MNIAVCLKRAPDTNAKIKIAADGKSIDPQGVEFVISAYDEFAIEEALRIKEKAGAGEIVGLCVDPDGNDTALRKGLAMGLDRGILIKGGNVFDGYVTAELLAGALKGQPFDLILFGKQSVDSDSYQVPAMVAHLLGLPRVNVVTKMEIQDKKVVCRRQIEGGEEIVELPMPCIISAQKGLNEPRFPSLKGIMAAKKKTVEVRPAPAVEARLEVVKLEPPPARAAGRIVGKGVEAVPELVRLLREEAKVI